MYPGFGENEHLLAHLLSALVPRTLTQPLSLHVLARAEGPATLSRGRLTHPAAHVALDSLRRLWLRPGRRCSLNPGGCGCGCDAATHQAPLRHQEGAAGTTPSTPLYSQAAAVSRPGLLPAQSARASRSGPLPAASACRAPCSPRATQKEATEASLEGGARRRTGALLPRRMRPGAGQRSPSPVTWRRAGGAKVGSWRAGGWGRKSEVSRDVRVESGRSGRLRAEVRLRRLSAIVDPRSEEREGEEEPARRKEGPLPRTPEREALFLASERAAAAAPAGSVTRRRAAANCCECTGRGPSGGGGGGSSSRVAVKNVSH